MKKCVLALAVAAALPAGQALAQDSLLEEITIFADREAVRELPGTAALVDNEQIRIEAATDINQLLKTVPGIYIREEDGYGLRPNIGIRGATSERASKVTLMEDGVPIAPAPYTAPAAYYFPTTARMHAVEVLKGAPLLRYGPQTTGGVINLVSTPIPEQSAGYLNLRGGEDGEMDLLANYGARSGNFGFLVETAQRRSDGYKDIDRSRRDSGYDISDYVVKLAWETDTQALLFKAQYSEEVSDETYLGLTDADFARDENRRYGLSSIDEMDNDHTGYNLTYRLALNESTQFTATAYHNEFARNWFKLGGGGAFIAAANAGDAEAQGILDGTVDVAGLGYKNNNREYESTGLELNLDIEMGSHQLALGTRYHEDEMDRYQPVDVYDQVNGELVYVETVAPTGSDNRFEDSEALAFWALDTWQVNEVMTLNLALRYEDVESTRRQWADSERLVDPSRRSSDSREWLPGISMTYDVTPSWQLLVGVHRGFSPLEGGGQDNEDPETSTNWEAGVRYQGDWYAEAVGFYSDFENKAENCSNANPCSNGATSGSLVTGEAVIQGLEFQLGTVMERGGLAMPLDLSYTWTDASISEDSQALGFADGDELADIPEHVFSLRAGIETDYGWNNYAVVKYVDEMCMSVGCNNDGDRFDRSEDLWVVDVISRYALNEATTVYARVENLFDEQAIVSRVPDGARPNKPRTASVGVEWFF